MPARKAAALKIAEGRGGDTDKAGRPVVADQGWVRLPPQPPDGMDGHALACWHETVDALQRLKLTKEADHPTLVAYCETYDRLMKANAELRTTGLLDEGSHGLKPHPLVGIVERASALLIRLANELGMTPAAEQRIGAAAKDDGGDSNPFE